LLAGWFGLEKEEKIGHAPPRGFSICLEDASKQKEKREDMAMRLTTKESIRETYLRRERSLVVTVDAGKEWLDALARMQPGVDLGHRRFRNTVRGYQKMLKWMRHLQKTYGLRLVVVGMESTGSYTKPLQQFLYERGIMVVQVNPAHVKKTKDLEDNTPNKSDKKDPRVIADLVCQGKFLTVHVPTGVFASLRICVRAREQAVRVRTQFLNRLEAVVFEVFPDLFGVFKTMKSRTVQAVLRSCPNPKAMVELGLDA
jgi:transposase